MSDNAHYVNAYVDEAFYRNAISETFRFRTRLPSICEMLCELFRGKGEGEHRGATPHTQFGHHYCCNRPGRRAAQRYHNRASPGSRRVIGWRFRSCGIDPHFRYWSEQTRGCRTRSNTSIVKVGTGGKISIYNRFGLTGVNVDVQGYFTSTSDAASPGGFTPVAKRVAASVLGEGMPAGTIAVGASRDIQVTNGDTIPPNANAIFANVQIRDAVNVTAGAAKIGPGGTSTTALPVSMDYNDSGPYDSGMTVKLSSSGGLIQTVR